MAKNIRDENKARKKRRALAGVGVGLAAMGIIGGTTVYGMAEIFENRFRDREDKYIEVVDTSIAFSRIGLNGETIDEILTAEEAKYQKIVVEKAFNLARDELKKYWDEETIGEVTCESITLNYYGGFVVKLDVNGERYTVSLYLSKTGGILAGVGRAYEGSYKEMSSLLDKTKFGDFTSFILDPTHKPVPGYTYERGCEKEIEAIGKFLQRIKDEGWESDFFQGREIPESSEEFYEKYCVTKEEEEALINKVITSEKFRRGASDAGFELPEGFEKWQDIASSYSGFIEPPNPDELYKAILVVYQSLNWLGTQQELNQDSSTSFQFSVVLKDEDGSSIIWFSIDPHDGLEIRHLLFTKELAEIIGNAVENEQCEFYTHFNLPQAEQSL